MPYKDPAMQRAAQRKWEDSPKGQATREAATGSPARLVSKSRYNKSPKGKRTQKAYRSTEQGKAAVQASNRAYEAAQSAGLTDRYVARALGRHAGVKAAQLQEFPDLLATKRTLLQITRTTKKHHASTNEQQRAA